jgi:type II secretory pathway pseudopilin PulG
MLNNKNYKPPEPAAPKNDGGFTLVEAIVAIFIVTIGLIGTAAAITYALEFGSISRNVSSAKSVIISTIEEMETLRNTRQLGFGQIAAVGAVNNTDVTKPPFSGFSTGLRPVSKQPGADGVNGTADDLFQRGADGILGTADDVEDATLIRPGYERQIEITNLSNSQKRIEITVQYVGRAAKLGEISGVFYLNDEARVTR